MHRLVPEGADPAAADPRHRRRRMLSSAVGGRRDTGSLAAKPAADTDGGPRNQMAKRSRGARPGQRRPAPRPAQRPAPQTATAPRPSNSLTAEEEARAAEIEAEIVAQDRAADEARARSRDRSRTNGEAGTRSRTREGSVLATRSAEEYTYVVRDVRRIVRVGGGLMVVLVALWLVLEVVKPF